MPALGDGGVRAVAAGYVDDDDADGRSALVRLTATWRPPIASPMLPVAVPVTVESSATARFR